MNSPKDYKKKKEKKKILLFLPVNKHNFKLKSGLVCIYYIYKTKNISQNMNIL